MKKLLLGLVLIVAVGVGVLFGSSALTKDKGTELAMALDNVNPLVKVTTVYAKTDKVVRKFTGGAGEDEYVYRLQTVNANGEKRWLTFNAQHRLKLNHYLKIETKGQNVESWEAVSTSELPNSVANNLPG
ncbi:hypothetical protein LFAB_10825 [Lactiplantibacillus fabifermentans T30PCM01]|uniref:YxeA family protein n=1 Tax=Lactiplantibacillus fabifermentans T30PCM01 TaxID=1400520 RepID=W6T6M1_9LACO|nr:YxeA family protein [Lactiplantibacillus fabifermentans]ETY73734.1 hypothetical protein LFAB_10825 [Lactiplantibacillus fabifermentans T30PCM01]